MARANTQYVCKNCTYQTLKWIGCCPDCKSWDSLILKQENKKKNSIAGSKTTTIKPLNQVPIEAQQRVLSGINEWDRVTGEGMIPGSFIILTGDPGIGKSTLLLQISFGLANTKKVYYFSTEESVQQVALRAQRLFNYNTALCVSSESNLESIIATAEQDKPDILVIDSLQNCFLSESRSTSSISQLREAALKLMRVAKQHAVTIIVSGHITKDGAMAGPKTLEHMVDAVFYLQAENQWQTRVLRSIKNRFGTINELGFFQMESNGLVEVTDINHQLINTINHSPGSALISIQEGSRPLLLELQALTIESRLTIPQRIISGVDHKQVILIAAILEKYLKVRLSAHDIFFKISGGMKIKGHTSDLGIALALLSSYLQEAIPKNSLVLGEISVTGYIKPLNNSNLLLKEAKKFGIKHIIASKQQDIPQNNCTLFPLEHVYELLSLFSKSE